MSTLKLYDIPVPELSEFKITNDGKIWACITDTEYKISTHEDRRILIVSDKYVIDIDTVTSKVKDKIPLDDTICEELFKIPNDERLTMCRITKSGKVWHCEKEKFLRIYTSMGYKGFKLDNKRFTLSRVIAFTFVPNNIVDTESRIVVDHINSDTLDNRPENLQWLIQGDNVRRTEKQTSHPEPVVRIAEDGTRIIFESVEKGAESIKLKRTTVSKACNGNNKTAGGYKWEFVDEKLNEQVRERIRNKKEGTLSVNLNNAKQIGETKYYLFKNGDVYSKHRNIFLKPVPNKNKCYTVTINYNGTKHSHINDLINKFYPDDRTEWEERVKELRKQNFPSNSNNM